MFEQPNDILKKFLGSGQIADGADILRDRKSVLQVKGLSGSANAFVISALHALSSKKIVAIIPDKEEAAYFLNDLEVLLPGKNILFYPASYRRAYQSEETDNANIMLRTEVLEKIAENAADIIVTYPSAISEKVITREKIAEVTLTLKKGEAVDLDFVTDMLIEYDFEREDFVYEPGQFALRGGIIDVFSYSDDLPYRIEFDGDKVYSIRTFNPEDQLSVKELTEAKIIPNIENKRSEEIRQSFFDFISADTVLLLDEPKPDLPKFLYSITYIFLPLRTQSSTQRALRKKILRVTLRLLRDLCGLFFLSPSAPRKILRESSARLYYAPLHALLHSGGLHF
jgi:transcription-repair coupling factor (superfamily II helicase)